MSERASLQSLYDFPLPEWGVWVEYNREQGYVKRLCKVRVKGKEYGPIWPNAGHFNDGKNRFSEDEVSHIYYLTEEDYSEYMGDLRRRNEDKKRAEPLGPHVNTNNVKPGEWRMRSRPSSQQVIEAAQAKRERKARKRSGQI